MGFQQGLSGLRASSTSLDVIGNNIANASTVGFKAAHAQFSDIYARTMHTAAANQVGIGTMVMRVQQQFTQGNMAPSANSLDLAINGNGFFRFSDKGTILYSRNGQLELTKDGYLVNGVGHRLTGYMVAENGTLIPGAPVDIQLGTEMIDPNSTTSVMTVLNLDSREFPIDASIDFDPTDAASYNHATAIDVYDSLGNMHVLQLYYRKTAPPAGGMGNGQWDVYAVRPYWDENLVPPGPNPGYIPDVDPPIPVLDLEFDRAGIPVSGMSVPFTIPGINGANDIDLVFDLAGTTQFGSRFAVSDNQQNGYAPGNLTGFSVDDYGFVLGRYSNGQTRILAQVMLTHFRNPNGLASIGDNEWAETMESGAPINGTPLSGPFGSVRAYYVEESNVDLTHQLIEMIIAQRVYQANAQTIKTQDQIMQTLVNLR